MARFGAHAFIWTSDWTPESAKRVISSAQSLGLDFVEVPLLHPESLDVATTRALLEEYGIQGAGSLGLPADKSLPEEPEKAETFLRGAVDAVAAFGSDKLSGVIYGTLGAQEGRRPTAEDYDTIAKSLKRVAQYAADKGVSLGVEPVNRYETYLVNLTSQGLDLLARIDEPNVFLHMDTYHMNIEERGFTDPIIAAGDKLGYIHLSESDRGTPGTGNVHWEDVFAGLAKIGYQGDLVMESFVELNPDIARATCIWRDIVEDPEALIRDGLSFLRENAKRHGLIS